MSLQLRAEQAQAIKKLKTGSILIGDVGTGKTVTSLSYFSRKAPERPIMVLTTAKKRNSGEWFEDAMKLSLRTDMEVDSWNNISKYVNHKGYSFIFDEQRVVGHGKWTKDFLKIAANNDWILLTATPADTYMDLIPVLIANGFYKNRTEFCEKHVRWSPYTRYPKVAGFYSTDILDYYRSQLYVPMPVVKKAVREDHFIDVDFSEEEQTRIKVDRWNPYLDEPVKDAGEMIRLLRQSSNTNWSRYSAVKSICKTTPKVIIFYNLNYELDILRGLAEDLDVPVAEYNGHVHQNIPQADRWVYLVQTQAGAEGWNCIETDTVVFYSLPYSYRAFEQAKGRIDRLNTPYKVLHYYILRSASFIDQSIWRSVRRKKNFQALRFIKRYWDEAA